MGYHLSLLFLFLRHQVPYETTFLPPVSFTQTQTRSLGFRTCAHTGGHSPTSCGSTFINGNLDCFCFLLVLCAKNLAKKDFFSKSISLFALIILLLTHKMINWKNRTCGNIILQAPAFHWPSMGKLHFPLAEAKHGGVGGFVTRKPFAGHRLSHPPLKPVLFSAP